MGWDLVVVLGFYVFSFVVGVVAGYVVGKNWDEIWPRFSFQEKLKIRPKKAQK